MCPSHVTASLIGLDFGSYPKLVTFQGANHIMRGSSGCKPIQVDSQINVKHAYSVSTPSYAVDVHICMSPYHVTSALVGQAVGFA